MSPPTSTDPIHRGAGRPNPTKLAALARLSAFTLPLVPRIPDRVKRLLLGGRKVTIDGNTLDTTLQFVLSAQRVSGVDDLVATSDVTAARRQLRKLTAAVSGHVSVDVRDLTVAGGAGVLRARHYRPIDASGVAPLLVFFHGGGFVIGDLDTHDELCRLICRDAEVHVLAVDYRLAPEHPAPAAVDDAYAAYRWAVEHAADLGADPDRVAVGGDSAGGNLAAVVSQLARGDGGPLPALQLLIYPVTHAFHGETRSMTLFAEHFLLTKADMDWFGANYLGAASIDAADPRISPLLADDLGALPPAVVVTAGFDGLRDEGDQYAAALVAAGVPVDHLQFGTLVHGFANFFPLGGDAARATGELVSAVRARLGRS